MTVPFTGLSKHGKLLYPGIMLIGVVAMLGVVFSVEHFKPKQPTLEERVDAVEYHVLRVDQSGSLDRMEMEDTVDRLTKEVRDLEEWVADVEKKCDQCIGECGGLD